MKKYVNWNRPIRQIRKEEVMGRRVEALESTLSLLREEKECLCVVATTEVTSPLSADSVSGEEGDTSGP